MSEVLALHVSDMKGVLTFDKVKILATLKIPISMPVLGRIPRVRMPRSISPFGKGGSYETPRYIARDSFAQTQGFFRGISSPLVVWQIS